MGYDIGPRIGIDGEAEFRRSIQEVNASLKTLGTEMSRVTSQFARNDKSQENLTQQNKVLNKQMDLQRQKILGLQQGLSESARKYGENDVKTQRWQQAVNKAVAELNKMDRQLQDNNANLERLAREAEEASDSLDDVGEEANDVGHNLEGAGKSAISFGDVLKANVIADFIVDGIRELVDGLKDLSQSFIDNAATVKAETAQFESAFGSLQESAEKSFEKISDDTGILEERLKIIGTQAFSQFKGAGLEAGEALEKTGEFTKMAADAAAYYDISLEEASEKIRSFTRGNTEAGDAVGLFTSEGQRNQASIEMWGSKYKDLTEAQKQIVMLDIASSIYETNGAMGQAARESDGWENVMGNLKEVWKQFTAVLGTPLLQGVIPIVQGITEAFQNLIGETPSVSEFFNDLSGMFQNSMSSITEKLPEINGMISQVFSGLANAVATNGPVLLDSMTQMIVSFAQGMAEGLPEMIPKAVDAVAGFVENITGNLQMIIDAGFSVLMALGEGIVNAIPNLVTKVPEIVINIADVINNNAPRLIVSAVKLIGQLVKGLIQNIPVIVANIPKIIEAIVKAFLAFNWLNLGKSLMVGLKSGIKSSSGFIKQAAGDISNTIKTKIKELPAKLIQVGKDIVKGLGNGIKAGAKWAKDAILNLAKDMLTDVKAFFGIHSPSRVFQDEVGKNIVLGIEKGVTENEKTVIKSVSELSKHILSEATKWVDDKKFYNDLALEDELAFWEDLKKMEGLQGAELEEIDRKIYTAKQGILKEQEDAEKKFLDAQKKVQEEQKKAFEEYEKSIDSRTNSLKRFAGIFDKIESDQEVTGKELLDNLKGQVEAFKNWQADIDDLDKKGISENLLSELREMGPKAADEIHALTTLSDTALQEYVDLFEEKGKLASEQAKSEIGEFEMPITLVNDEEKVEVNTESVLGATDFMMGTMQTGIENNINKIQESATKISKEFMKTVKSFKDDFVNVGANITDGLWEGIESGKSGLINNIVDMLEDAVEAAKDAMDIHSPSRVWAKIGGFMASGLGVGFTGEMVSVAKDINRSIPAPMPPTSRQHHGSSYGGYDSGQVIQKEGDKFILQVENLNNSNNRNVHDFFREAEFYFKQKRTAKGEV